jgi:hypothetical protein
MDPSMMSDFMSLVADASDQIWKSISGVAWNEEGRQDILTFQKFEHSRSTHDVNLPREIALGLLLRAVPIQEDMPSTSKVRQTLRSTMLILHSI